jgi:peptidoglycan hydrolase CwlO-like protein
VGKASSRCEEAKHGRAVDLRQDQGSGKLEGRSQFAMDSRQNFLSDGKHGKLNPWYLYFWELADKYELLASTVTELSAAVGAVDANTVPAAITTGGYDSSASKRKRTPWRRHRGSHKKDDDSASSGGSSGTRKKNADAELTSALATLGNETKMSRIGQHISALREDARSINRRIAELKQFIHQYQINAMKTNLQDEHVMYMGFITDYTTELNDLKSQLDDIAETIKKQEQKLDD